MLGDCIGRVKTRPTRINPRSFPMLRRLLAALIFFASCTHVSLAADADVLWPPETTLTRAGATQRLFLGEMAHGQVVGDRTAQATYSSSNPNVATVDTAGI